MQTLAVPMAGCQPTPGDILGPYYQIGGVTPVPSRQLSQQFCKPAPAKKGAQRLQMSGVIRGPDCKPINGETAGLILEIWQADNSGTYDDNQKTNDSNNCRAAVQIGRDGRYIYTTIRPGKYGSIGCLRPAHIHLRVRSTKNAYQELVTQMYFPNDSNLGAKDCACQGCSSGNKRLLAQPVKGKQDQATFDVFLAKQTGPGPGAELIPIPEPVAAAGPGPLPEPAPIAEPGATYGHH